MALRKRRFNATVHDLPHVADVRDAPYRAGVVPGTELAACPANGQPRPVADAWRVLFAAARPRVA